MSSAGSATAALASRQQVLWHPIALPLLGALAGCAALAAAAGAVAGEDSEQASSIHPALRGGVGQGGEPLAAGRAFPGAIPEKLEAILRSLIAGLSTSLGAGVVLLLRGAPSSSQMAFALALAGGVMLTVSVLEMFAPELSRPERWPEGALGIALGFGCFSALKALVPEPHPHMPSHQGGKASAEEVPSAEWYGAAAESEECANICGDEARSISGNPKLDGHEMRRAGDGEDSPGESSSTKLSEAHQVKQWRLAVLLTLALTAHNFPEGLAVAVSSLQSDRLGFVVMAAIAVHNIPEGIAIAMPVIDATGSRWRAMQMATLSGLAEPLGALVAVALLPEGSTQGRGMDFLLCVVGGVMSCVAFTELLPEARAQGRPWSTAAGLAAGAGVMLLTHQLA